MPLSCVNAQAYMKHNSRKHVVPEWKICKDRKFSHLPLSPSIETSRKHLGLLFSDIFHAKRKRKQALTTHEGTVYTRGHTRMPFTTWHTGGYRWSDHWFLDKMAATGWTKTVFFEDVVTLYHGDIMSNKMKTAIFIGGFAVFTLGALYPIVVYPKLHPEVYSKLW